MDGAKTAHNRLMVSKGLYDIIISSLYDIIIIIIIIMCPRKVNNCWTTVGSNQRHLWPVFVNL